MTVTATVTLTVPVTATVTATATATFVIENYYYLDYSIANNGIAISITIVFCYHCWPYCYSYFIAIVNCINIIVKFENHGY